MTNFGASVTLITLRVIERVLGGQRDRCQKAEAERREEVKKPSARQAEVGWWRTAKEMARLLGAIFIVATSTSLPQ